MGPREIGGCRPRFRIERIIFPLYVRPIISIFIPLLIAVCSCSCRDFYPGSRRGCFAREISGVPGEDNQNLRSISVGGTHICLLTDGGEIWCRGRRIPGRTKREAFWEAVTTMGMDDRVVSVSAGHSHACGLTAEGAVKCWGHNEYGQLGDGTNMARKAPVRVRGLDDDTIFISTGGFHTCVLSDRGEVRCWGLNYSGQIGDGTRENRNLPVRVVLESNIVALASGGFHTCAVDSRKDVFCWGYNYYGQLGGVTENDFHAVPMRGNEMTGCASEISAGGWHTCGVHPGGARCWGYHRFGPEGGFSAESVIVPVASISLPGPVDSLSSGGILTCAHSGGNVWCWGGPGKNVSPRRVEGISGRVISLSCGPVGACSISDHGRIYCWECG